MTAFAGAGAQVVNTTAGNKAATLAGATLNDLLVVVCVLTGATAAPTVTDDNSSGTYTEVTGGALKNTSADSIWVFVRRALVPATASTIITMTSPGGDTGGGLLVYRVTGMSRVNSAAVRQIARQQNQAAGGTPAPVFPGVCLTGNSVIGAVFNATNPATMTPTASPVFTEKHDTGYATPTTGVETQTIDSGFTGSTLTWGGTSASAFASVAVELDASAASSNVTIIVPSPAAASAAAIAPGIFETILPGVAQATAAGLAPAILETILPAAATATAAALAPVVKATVLPGAAAATAAALVPVVMDTIAPPVAAATAQALVPLVIYPVTIVAPAATATAAALLPTVKDTILPAAATATATALVPVIAETILPSAATATAQALAPLLLLPITLTPPAATATAAALVPVVKSTIAPPVATATAAALTPTVKVTILPASAAATARALAPTITGPIPLGTILFVPPVSQPSQMHGLLPAAHGQYQDALAVSTVRGRYTFSSSYTTGGEPVAVPIQRVLVQLLPASRAGGFGVRWTGTKMQAFNLDVSGNITTEVAAGTDLSAVTVPVIAYVIAH